MTQDTQTTNEPVIPCDIKVMGTFSAGVKVSTVQGAIDRLRDRYEKLARGKTERELLDL